MLNDGGTKFVYFLLKGQSVLFLTKNKQVLVLCLGAGGYLEFQFHCQATTFEICGGQSGTATGFSHSTLALPSVSFHECSILIADAI